MSFDHLTIDAKWQKKWEEAKAFKADINWKKPKFYALNMFPYPSGSGLHCGHLVSFTPTDIVARYKRACGFNVLNPIGYDAFGLPAEQYAIQTGIHPAETTRKAINNFRRQMKSFGYSFDWDREISTCEPDYYKWTQYIFIKLFEKGLAYEKEAPVNWCPDLRTVLANDEVVDGKSERGGHPVIQVPMKQWMLRITAYAEKLLEGLEQIAWPERTKEGQRNWIGKSIGAEVDFQVANSPHTLRVFTTRPDTLFGVTFMVIAPEHKLLKTIVTAAQQVSVNDYVLRTAKKSEIDRKANTEKTGVFTGAYAIHPVTGTQIPIWTADYVLLDYGTGAIMAVPGHDVRDFEFAQTFHLPVKRVLTSESDLPFEGDGLLVNSQFIDGLNKEAAINKMIDYLEQHKLGARSVNFKLRDWLFSRQRYWGEPFPLVRYPDGVRPLPQEELPLVLPQVPNYEPSEKGEAPLARISEWLTYQDKTTGAIGERISDTMPGSAGSSWYFLRYTDPNNQNEFASIEAQKYWLPVDLYIGGPEHTVGHLLYARFWQKVLFDAGLTVHDEPFTRLAHQGMLLGPDGEKMSKSRGNVVNPDEYREKYGADSLRTYLMFLGPMDRDKPWSTMGIEGVRRFFERIYRYCVDDKNTWLATATEPLSSELEKLRHKTIKKVSEDIESLNFNTAISAMMIFVNELYKTETRSTIAARTLTQLIMPFAPHLAEELWEKSGEQSFVSLAAWPSYDPALTVDDLVTVAVQVCGKMRGTIELNIAATEQEALSQARQLMTVKSLLESKELAKVIYKPGKIINLIVK